MKKKLSQKELAELRKREQHRKELEFQVGRDLKLESAKMDIQEKFEKEKSPYVIAAINFFGTLIISYFAFFIIKRAYIFFIRGYAPEIVTNVIFTVSHVLIWGISVIAVVRKRSPLDGLFDRFS